MAKLEEGTEGKDAVAQADAEGGDSREFRAAGEDEAAMEQASSKKPRSKAPWVWGALGLGIVAGLCMGFVARAAQVSHAKEEARAVQGKGDEASGPCKVWADTICEGMGELAYECTEARAAASTLLSDSACTQAQENVRAKIDALKSERVQCSELTNKLCAELGPDGKGCEFVRAKEPAFSLKECQDMTQDYKQVLARVMERQEKGTIPAPPQGRQSRSISISKAN